jgi:hypothetical protein
MALRAAVLAPGPHGPAHKFGAQTALAFARELAANLYAEKKIKQEAIGFARIIPSTAPACTAGRHVSQHGLLGQINTKRIQDGK